MCSSEIPIFLRMRCSPASIFYDCGPVEMSFTPPNFFWWHRYFHHPFLMASHGEFKFIKTFLAVYSFKHSNFFPMLALFSENMQNYRCHNLHMDQTLIILVSGKAPDRYRSLICVSFLPLTKIKAPDRYRSVICASFLPLTKMVFADGFE